MDNLAMNRFEMSLSGDALAVTYFKVEGGRVMPLHTEVPQELFVLGYGSRQAHSVSEALRRDGCLLMSSRATPALRIMRTPRLLTTKPARFDAKPSSWKTIPHAYQMHGQREFLILSTESDPESRRDGREARHFQDA